MIDPPEIREARRKVKAHDRSKRAARPKTGKGRVTDAAYIRWLHNGIPCIGCEIEQNPHWPTVYPIEAAHQRHAKGRGGMAGRRCDDADTVPLCAGCHRLAPNACDPAQRKFWDRLGIDVGEFCREMYAAFKEGRSGDEVVRRFKEGVRR